MRRLAALLALSLATPAVAQDVYAPADSGQPATLCVFGPAQLCYVETAEAAAGASSDTDACLKPHTDEPIEIEFAKLAMHSGVARIRRGDGPFRRTSIATATGADIVAELEGVTYVFSGDRMKGRRVLLLSRIVEDTDYGFDLPVVRVRVGECAAEPVYWSDAFMRGTAK